MSTVQEIDFSINLLDSLLWQNNAAETLTALLQSKQDWYTLNQTQFWNDWVRDVFDLRTANAFGLQVWARILKIPLQIALPPSLVSKPTFGYGNFNKNYDNGNYSSINGSAASLSIEEQRLVLRLRYFQLFIRPTVPKINRMLKYIFGHLGRVYVVDNLNMTQQYIFDFAPSSQLTFILDSFDLLPRPAAVGTDILRSDRPVYGYGDFYKNYDNGNYRG